MKKSKTALHHKSATTSSTRLGDFPNRFRQHLSDQHYAATTIKTYMICLHSLAMRMEAKGISLRELDEVLAVKLMGRMRPDARYRTNGIFIVKRFVRFLNEQGAGKPPPPPTTDKSPWAQLRRDYDIYLRHQRGLSEGSILRGWQCAENFLKFHFGAKAPHVSKLTPLDIVTYLQNVATRKKPHRDKSISSHLRNFCRYLFKTGKTKTNLSFNVPSVRQRCGARLQRHLRPEHVEALLEAVRSNANGGRRNYAMVLLVARLGLRAHEVVVMQIDDIDWRSGEVIVRGKGGRHDRVPLPSEVGEVLADYIQHERVPASRALFMSDRAPHRPFKDGQILNMILRGAFARTGLKPPAPYVGSHVLRHSLATNLVRRGAALEEVGDMLRHRSQQSTMLYARMDVDGLRSIAQPWPMAGGAK